MASLTLRKGTVLPDGRTVTGLVLDSPHEIAWQKAGKPPRLRSVTVELDGPGGPDLVELYAELQEQDTRRTITAQFGGPCRGCGNRYETGDEITYSEDEGAWVCGECAARE